MAQYATLKAAIDAVIKANGQREITGTVLNHTLNAMVNSLGANFQFAGVATPSTNPGTPDQNVFYLAFEAGTYTNFNATVLSAGISILMWNGSWSSQTFYTIDATPTASSNNLISSGAVFDAIKTDGSAYDVSAHFPTGGPNSDGKFTLEYILSNANTLIPAAWRKGGMSIRFVSSSDNKYVQARCMAQNFTTDTTQWAIADEGVYVDNPEFVYVKTDSEGKILWAIKTDGSIYYGAGVPSQVVNYINEKIAELSLDEYEDIVTFLSDYLGSDTTLKAMIDGINAQIATKVNKVEGKSLIDAEYASTKYAIDNPEFLDVTLDAEDKVLEGIKADGIKVIGGNLNVGGAAKIIGEMEVAGVSYKVIESPEYLAAWVDAKDKIIFGIKVDGKTYVGDADFLNDINNIKAFLKNITDKNVDWDALTSITATENPELIEAKTDSEGKLLAGRTSDGAAFENVGFTTPKVSIDGHTIENIEDPEGRSEIKADKKQKIISYRDEKGILHENVGIDTPNIKLSEEGLSVLSQELKPLDIYNSPNLPKYGTTNIKTETFYLTAHSDVSSIDDVVCIQDVADTEANANDRMTICHYYVKSTLTDNGDGTYSINANSVKLQHYASGKVKLNADDNKYYAKDTVRKVDGVWYYADTLGYNGTARNKVINGYSVVYQGEPSAVSVASVNTEVVQIVGPANVNTWTVEDWDFNAVKGTDIGKKYEHQCICDVDFGHFYSKNNVAIGVKHQGNSTQIRRKRNYRYTFYKNATFAKKDKIKIGEMLRLSKFNLKANWADDSRIKELILYRIFGAIWNNRPITDRYNWDGNENGYFHGVTGNIHGFPIRLNVNGEFYGVYTFLLPKDGKNYLIDDEDESTGLFVSGAHNDPNDWGSTLPYVIRDHYDSEMDSDDFNDYPGIVAALTEWTHFINNRLYKGSDNNTYNSTELTEVGGVMYVTSSLEDGQVVEGSISATLIEFNKENAYKRLDVLGFIDYLICLQFFMMVDNLHNNILIYSDTEKKKMFPFFYDVDQGIITSRGYDADILGEGVAYTTDISLWSNINDIYWDDIVNRYCVLRKTYLSIDYITAVYNDISKYIPESDYQNEKSKWGQNTNSSKFKILLEFLRERATYLDTFYYKV